METSILAVLAAAGGSCAYALLSFNRLIALRERCDQAYADIEVQLKQRHDLIPQLVETVRGYVRHEQETLQNVVSARSHALAAPGTQAQMAAEKVLGESLQRLLAVAEAYPDLKASPHFVALREEMVDAENKIAAARRFLNLAVTEHNTALGQFPGALIGRMFSIQPRRVFDLGLDRIFLEDAPRVKL